MLTKKEAEILIEEFISLRDLAEKNKDNETIERFRKHERLCMEKFKYLVSMRTDSYKGYYNYEDLNQDGLEALVKAMVNYDPKKGSFFYWAHRYIKTRISRSANLHTTIRFPLKFAKANTPHKEPSLPVLTDNKPHPEKNVETVEVSDIIKSAMNQLNEDQINVITFAFGFDGDKPLSVSKICKKMNISRVSCIKTINSALGILKQNINL